MNKKTKHGKIVYAIKNLLARMNGDGGQFQDTHGMLAAIEAAETKFSELRMFKAMNSPVRDIKVRNSGVDDPDKVMYAMKNLLAVMNGDGGHFQYEFGMLASIKAATQKYHDLRLHEARYPHVREIHVRNSGVGDCAPDQWYIIDENQPTHPRGYNETYLWNDLTWNGGIKPEKTATANSSISTWPGYYRTQEEAEETVRKWKESQGKNS